MRRTKVAFAAAILWHSFTLQTAFAIPFDPAAVPDSAIPLGLFYSGTGGGFVGTADLRYDSSTGHLSYSVGGGDLFLPNTVGGLDHFGVFPGFFGWTANINQLGEMQGTGVASMILDLGNGPELLATGTVVDFGFNSVFCFPAAPDDCLFIFGHPQVSIEMSYVDSRIAQFLGNFWRWEGFLNIDMDERLLSDDFRCGASFASSLNCGRPSGDEIRGYQTMSEPHAIVLLGIGLLGFALAGMRARRVTCRT